MSAAEVEANLTDEQRKKLEKARALVAAGYGPAAAAKAAGITEDEKGNFHGLDLGTKKDLRGKYTGRDVRSKEYEAQALADHASRTPNEVVTEQRRAVIADGDEGVAQSHRYYDGIEITGEDPNHPGDYVGEGLEVKSGDATRRGPQAGFDKTVDGWSAPDGSVVDGRPAIVELSDGRVVRIVRTRVIRWKG